MTENDSELRELLENPRSAAFSRIKYLQSLGTVQQIREFMNGLFRAAVESKYQGDWGIVSHFLEEWEDVAIGHQFRGMRMPDEGTMPWARVEKPLFESVVALVTTGGVYVEGQKRFQRGDTTSRRIDRDTPRDRLRIWHPGYDTGPATRDINCIFPIERFEELAKEGTVGAVAKTHYSFMGLINDTERLSKVTAPQVAEQLKADGVDAVFLAST